MDGGLMEMAGALRLALIAFVAGGGDRSTGCLKESSDKATKPAGHGRVGADEVPDTADVAGDVATAEADAVSCTPALPP